MRWSLSDQVGVDQDTGRLVPYKYGTNHMLVGSVTSDYGHVVEITFTDGTVFTVPAEVWEETTNVSTMAAAIREPGAFPGHPGYSHGRIPPECWVCGLEPAAEGPNSRVWFRQFWHHRHQEYMPVCEQCTNWDKMKLRER